MCLIIKTMKDKNRPKPEYIRNGFKSQPDGTGVAWHQDGELHYEKELTEERAIELAETLPLGYTMHFRWASVGGKDKKLIHPFPISNDVPLAKSGVADGLLFHNGTWNDWANILVNHLSSRAQLPKGKWSDTRAMAYLVSIHGIDFLRLLDRAGKFVIMTKEANHTLGEFIEEDGVFYSNGSFRNGIKGAGTGAYTTHFTPAAPYNARTAPLPPKSNRKYYSPNHSHPAWNNPPAQTSCAPCAPSANTTHYSGDRVILTKEEFAELVEHYKSDIVWNSSV